MHLPELDVTPRETCNSIRALKLLVVCLAACGLGSGCAAFKPPEEPKFDPLESSSALAPKPKLWIPLWVPPKKTKP